MKQINALDVDVLIVGAGPVGLFLANECARRSLRWRLVETRAIQSEHSKALAIFPRTLEIFDMAGIVDPFLAVANRVIALTVVTHQRQIAKLAFTPAGTPYPFIAMVPQDVTERLLVEALQHRGGSVDYETTFVDASDEGDCVRITLERGGARSKITAGYVVGCDGAHSAVRHLLSLPFDGAEYSTSFMLADIETNETVPANELQLCPHEDGPIAVFPVSATRRRIVATFNDTREESAPSLDTTRSLVAQRGPRDLEARALIWSSFFRIHHRQVRRMRAGRIFVAGDAAHIHSPFGGQGMNTGLQDAWNLAWKLDFAARGFATDGLLESYTEERHRVGKQVIATTDALTRAMGTSNMLAQAVRNAVIPLISKLAPFQYAFVARLSELGIAYEGSPLVEGHGERFFDDSLRGGSGVNGRFILFLGADADPSVVGEALRCAESIPRWLELRRCSSHGITLVRPDGYAAFTSANGGATTVERVRSLLARQVRVS